MQKKKPVVRLLRIIMPIVAIICIVMFPPWEGIWAWITPLPDTVQEQLDDAIDSGLDGMIVYVDQANQPPALYAAGWKDRAAQIPADPQALFKIASISKLYIATAVAKLVNKQNLFLDDTLADYLPELVGRIEYADQITLKMMVQHRSGIPNYVDEEEFDWGNPLMEISENLALVLDEPADFEPDTDYRYSNTNYLLIGSILDKVLGYSHQQYIKSEIIAPLGLTNTYGLLSDVNLEDVASGYYTKYDGDLKTLDYVVPGGSMVATAQDVGVFLRALNDGALLNDDEQAIYSAIYKYEHKGWVLGYHSIARYYKDIDAVVIQFVNTTGGDMELLSNVVYGRIVRILRREQ
ncbi:serine hydrolase domain-containing protein [Bowmanella denitrificans]|uniref:serine hydrolase domain-containing protein n=1 Tax=Bowmanella denitrificans TaxID=366582 RepID=UPI0031CE4F92